MTRDTLRTLLYRLFRFLTQTRVVGGENLPAQGAFILATNHMSRLDVPLLFVTTYRNDLIALVADSYKSNPLFAWMVQTSGSIWIDRAKADFSAVRAGLNFLKSGGVLGIAPEGTRSREGTLIQAKNGVALLAEKARVPIIPVAISGTEIGVKRLMQLRRPHFAVCYGKPFVLPPIDREHREEGLQANTDEIMCRIAALLPPQYHGFYAHHPRLKELLSGDF